MSYVILNQNLDVCGVLDLNGRGCKFYDDVRTTKIADEQGKIWSDTLDISVPYGYPETDYITQGHHLLKEASDGYTYCYRIYNWVDGAIGPTHIKKALGLNLIAWDLTHKIVPANKFAMANSQDVFEWILQGSGWEINHNGFFGDSRPVEFNAGQNAMYWLDQQIANFNVEIRAYVQVYNGKIIRKLVDIVEELGESNGYRLEYEHDLVGLARSGDDSQLYTKLYVYGGNDANNNPISIASVNGNKDFLVDDDANDLYNNGDSLYLEGYVTNQDITNPGALLDWGKAQLKKFNHPRHTYGVDVAYLGYMPNLGDHFNVVDFSMSPALTINARVIQLEESEANSTANKITVGEFVDVIVVTPSDIRAMQAKADAAQAALEKAIALKNTFFRQDTEPTTASEGDFWIYTGPDYAIPPIQQLKNGVWVEANELKGAQGIQGQPGVDGKSTYLHVAYSDDGNGAGFSQSPTNKTWMGTYVDQIQNDSIDPTKYKWIKIQGPQGPQGPVGLEGAQGPQGNQGIAGPQGNNGLTAYTHIAYAQNASGTVGFSISDSTGAIYIGMYVDHTVTDSADPTKYKWTLIKGQDGSQGIQGPKGADGLTPYLHIAYATNNTGTAGFSVSDPTGKPYMGTYTDNTPADSTDPTKYTWSLIQGPQGAQGPQGLQGIQGPKGDQGIQGPVGANGLSSYTHIAYATNSSGTTGFSTSVSNGATYIGMYVDNTALDSEDPTKYNWTLIKGADGAQGIQGPTGSDGQTPYLHIAYATNASGTAGFSTTDATSKTYIGTYTDFIQNDSTDPTKYTWQLVQGPQGIQGPAGAQGIQGLQGPKGDQGIQGVKGVDGSSSYTHIAYAQNSAGTVGFSVSDSTGASYIGMYVDSVATDSTDPSKYKWTLFKGLNGAQGIQGPAGANGQTPYLHIAYATNSTGTSGFNVSDPTNATYIGTYTDYTPADSITPSDYTWAKMQGPTGPQGPQGNTGPQGLQGIQGPKGDQGIAGPAGSSSYTHIAYATNSTGTTGFSTSSGAGATYIGMYVDNTATDSTDPSKYEWTLIKGADGAQGIAGPKGIDGQTPYLHIAYATNSTGSTGFSTTDATGKTYIGTYTDFSQNDSTDATKYTWALMQGPQGPTGATGSQGPQGIQGNQGPQGIQGPTGANGVTTYTWVKYADDQYGGNMNDSPTGKRYLGLAYNKTVQQESTIASDYQWSPLYDNITTGDRNFILNSYYQWSQDGALSTTYHPPSPEGTLDLSSDLVGELNRVGKMVLQLMYKTTNVVWGTTNPWAGYELTITYTDATKSYFDCGGSKVFQTNTTGFVKQVQFYSIVAGKTVQSVTLSALVRDLTGTVEMRQFKAGVGNIETTWSPAPEDIQSTLDGKAEGSDLDDLAGAISLVTEGLKDKTDAGDFGSLKQAYDDYIAQAAIDAQGVADSLSKMDGRVTLAETLVGDAKLVTDFINTVITESEEGIYIANNASSTGILIASDRISFMDNNVEVAYINNQTMQINHGIFVESAVIANFNFELIPGTTILSIAWVGD